MPPSILACFAHPDDESFSSGGTLAHYASQGAEVTLVCATRGEAGEISDPALATPENLAEVREQELRCAADALGIGRVEFLGYRDSGMEGTDDNNNPLAYVMADRDEVIGKLVALIRELQPDVVITFDPDGAYGHPDHIAIHHHTVAAVAAARDDTRFPEAGPVWAPRRLYFTALSKTRFADMRRRLEEMGIDTSGFDRPDMPILGQEDDEIDVTMDVGPTLAQKRRALECHATQFGPDNFMRQLAGDVGDDLMRLESFTLWWGTPIPDGGDGDLFSGL
ncbi:MAG TPA: PIG-L family deacetylase [Actinomycetota bacterium]|nr:PIG-L family deacetylase [Actinomycetota bacterium]